MEKVISLQKSNDMENVHGPEEVAASIKEIIKHKYGNLNAYALEKNITPTQLYSLLSGKDYLSVFSAVRFNTDLDISIDYCTRGVLPFFNQKHGYNTLLAASRRFYYAVRDEDRVRDEYERASGNLSPDDLTRLKLFLEKLRIEKAKAGCALVDLFNEGWGEECANDEIKKPIIPKSTMKLHEAIQEVIRENGKAMTFTEIAKQINAKNLYTRKDGLPVPASQISARVKNYPQLFVVNVNANPKTISLRIGK